MSLLPSSTAGVRSRGTIVTALGLTQIMAWGSSYYLPAVIAPAVSAETGWSFPWVIGSLSLGLLVAGLISPHVGAAIERHGGRVTLAFSALCLGFGQLVLSVSASLAVFVIGWLIMGFGMGAGLYDAAFGTLGRLYGRNARSTITSLTLFGGFASTMCWPISAFLLDTFGWRGVCLVYAAIQLCMALPVYLLILPRGVPAETTPAAAIEPETGLAPRTLPLMATLAASITLSAVISSTLSVHLLTILQSAGLALGAAVGLGALVGPSQVGARAVEMAIARYHHPIWTKLASVTFVVIGVATLWTDLPVLPGALIFYGAGIGLESIARGTLPLALFGATGYAKLMGRLAMPSLIAQAAAPSVGALLLQHTGERGLLTALLGLALINIALVGALFALQRGAMRRARTS
ncbi:MULTISPECIES: MFS transporter [unclassified Mesorhizobium]|uniref:MFS transporter n=2 Tax=Mesorhizobium TaxID=68287 RepID=UPI00333655F0